MASTDSPAHREYIMSCRSKRNVLLCILRQGRRPQRQPQRLLPLWLLLLLVTTTCWITLSKTTTTIAAEAFVIAPTTSAPNNNKKKISFDDVPPVRLLLQRRHHQQPVLYKNNNVFQLTATNRFHPQLRLFASSKQQQEQQDQQQQQPVLPDIETMKLGEIRDELESYGISTKSFLEKTELITALETARAQGKQPTAKSSQQQQQQVERPNGEENDEADDPPQPPRQVRIQEEMEKANQMKIGELRNKLSEMGISTKSFFEKSEFVKAYAQAVVDGVDPSSSKKQQTKTSTNRNNEDEKYDPSYRDVVMKKMDRRDQLLLQGTIIDIRLQP